jgi:Flp pilus assembly protein TadD
MNHCLILLIFGFLAACSGQVPSFEEIKQDNTESRAGQLLRIADSTRQGGDLGSALALYRRAHAMAPDEMKPLIAIGETAFALQEFEQAANAYTKALDMDGEHLQALLGLGKTLLSLDRPDQAMTHFQSASQLYPANHRGFNGYGVSLDMMGRHEEAQNQYHKGIEVAPEAVSLSNNLALSLAFTGNFELAIGILEVFADDPLAGVRLRQNLALIYGLADMQEKAAKMAAKDLDEAGVANNLAYYAHLRELSSKARAQAVFGTPK